VSRVPRFISYDERQSARQAAAATNGAKRSSATAYPTRDPVPIALASDRERTVAASPGRTRQERSSARLRP
jgi:hypothetical protein